MDQQNDKSLSEVHASVNTMKKFGWRKLFSFLGPAYLISVGYMDPGNWATDIAAGSQYGYSLIWILLMSNIIAVLLQSLSARLGIVRGLDLAQASKNAYPSWANIPLWILAEIAIIACDLAEIIGMAIGLQLIFGLPLIWGVVITVFDTILLLYLMKRGIRYIELFIVSLVFIIGLSFLLEMFIVSPEIKEIAGGLIPGDLSGNKLYIAIGIIGATVMPHNLYLHSSLVQTRNYEHSHEGMKKAIRFNFFDTVIALNIAFLVNSAILILAAAAFYYHGYYDIAEIQDASNLLGELFGSASPILFGLALIAAGQSSTITGTLAGQIVMEGHLKLRLQPWIRRMITRLLAIIPALCTILFFGEDALGKLLVLSQVVLSLQLGFAIIPLIHFNSQQEFMREFTIKTWVKILAWLSAAVIVYLNIRLVINQIQQWITDAGEHGIYIYIFVIPIILACFGLLLFIFLHPFFKKSKTPVANVPHGDAVELPDHLALHYNRIGIAVDFSEQDKKSIFHALKNGNKDSQYYFIHVVESAGARYHGKQVRDNETKQDEENLKRYVSYLEERHLKSEYVIGYGEASKAISQIVKASDIEFLIMGAHGHKGVKDIIFGTTIDAVRHQLKIPILVVP